jgi:hypothetical protein
MSYNMSNSTNPEQDGWVWDDATWILGSSFIIFTMQTGNLIRFLSETDLIYATRW